MICQPAASGGEASPKPQTDPPSPHTTLVLSGSWLPHSSSPVFAHTKELAPGVSYKSYTLTSTDQARIRDKASEFSLANQAGKTSVSIVNADLVMGTYDPASGEITPTNTGVRAVSLRTRRDEVANGELPVALASVMGIQSVAIRATSA